MEKYLLDFYFFLVGSLFGSFTNVLIYRIPINKDFTFARSSCPSCGSFIKWYHNIPLLGFFLLKGKCRSCQCPIPVRYLLLEIFFGIMGVVLYPQSFTFFGFTVFAFQIGILVLLSAQFFIDLKTMILPDKLNLYLGLLFFAFCFHFRGLSDSFVGLAAGFGLPTVVTLLFYLVTGKMGLGGGDIKLFSALGIYLGVKGIIYNIFLSCMLGSLISLLLIFTKRIKRDSFIPFGPFIIFVAFLQIYFPHFFQRLFAPILPL